MPSYQELLKQIETLKKQADTARQNEIADAVAKIHQIMDQYGLTIKDLGRRASKPKGKRAKVAVKYRDPASGATWTGRGRAPKWIVEAEAAGKDRKKFLV